MDEIPKCAVLYYFPVVLFVMVFLPFGTLNKILTFDHSNESY